MAHLVQRRAENVSGDLYVDSTCIDCDTCRWMAPGVFYRDRSQSAVFHQPTTPEDRLFALQALLACPTASIGTVEPPKDIKTAQQSFPILVTENVYHCGYHAENSFGAASYLIVRPEGNVLVDSPGFVPPLVKRLEEMGGVRYLYRPIGMMWRITRGFMTILAAIAFFTKMTSPKVLALSKCRCLGLIPLRWPQIC
jgi:ferredoxin